jgi:hypothetical protein
MRYKRSALWATLITVVISLGGATTVGASYFARASQSLVAFWGFFFVVFLAHYGVDTYEEVEGNGT